MIKCCGKPWYQNVPNGSKWYQCHNDHELGMVSIPPMAVSLLLQEAMAEMSKSAEAGWVGLVTRVKDQLGMAVAVAV